MAEENEVEIKFGASIEGLLGGVEEVRASLERIARPVHELQDSFGELKEAFIAAFAVEKISEFAEHMGELGEETERMSKMLGISTEAVGELDYEAKMTGTSTEGLTVLISRFEAGLSQAEKGAGRMAAGLKVLGLSARELSEMNPAQQLREIAEATSKFADGSAKTAALQDLGRGFTQLIPLLDEGAEGFDELKQKADDAGAPIDALTTGALVNMQHGIVNLKETIENATLQGFKPFIDVVNGAVGIMTDLAHEFTESAKSGGLMADAMSVVSTVFKETEQFIGETIIILENLGTAGSTAMSILTDAVIGWGKVFADIFEALAKLIPNFFTALLTAGQAAFSALESGAMAFGRVLSDVMHLNVDGAKADFASIGAAGGEAMQKIGSAFSGVADFSKAKLDAGTMTNLIDQDVKIGQDAIDGRAKMAQHTYDKIWGITGKNADPRGEGGAAPGSGPKGDWKPANEMPVVATNHHGGKNQAARDAEADAQAELALLKANATAKEQILDDELKNHQITMAQWLTQTKDALGDEYQDEVDVYERELQIAGLTTAQKIKIKEQEALALIKFNEQIQKAEQKSVEETMKQWQSAMQGINGAVDGQIKGLLEGTTTWHTALVNVLKDLSEQVVKFFANWTLEQAENAAKAIVFGNAQVAQHLAGDAAMTAADQSASAAGLAGVLGNVMKSVEAFAGQAAAGVTAFLAPIIGPAAPAAGAAAGAATIALGAVYDTGAWNVGGDMVAGLHKGEVVIPQRGGLADQFRDMVSNGGFGGGGQGGGDTHVHFNVSAIDRAGVRDFFHDNGHHVMSAISKSMKGGGQLKFDNLR